MEPSKIYGLVGYPLKHSFSPLMHNAAFSALKIKAEYKLFPLKPDELSDFFGSLAENKIFGLNITVPYKEKVIPFLDDLSDETRLIGAVNTIKFSSGKLQGFNTDGFGFLTHLKEGLKFNPGGRTIALIGAGGACRAIAVYLGKANSKRLTIYDIDEVRAISLAGYLKEKFSGVEFIAAHSIDELNILGSDLLINATPIGMKETDPSLVSEHLMHKNLLVYDLIYNPQETKLLTLAKNAGAKTANGLGMLLYQGMSSFEIWTGKKAPKEQMQKALTGAL